MPMGDATPAITGPTGAAGAATSTISVDEDKHYNVQCNGCTCCVVVGNWWRVTITC